MMMKILFIVASMLINGISGFSQNVGIGITTPLTRLHIRNGASGAVPFAFSPLAVESNGHTYINLLSPVGSETAILFGQAGSSANGVLMYNHESTPNGFQFRTNGNSTKMTLNSNGNLGIGTMNPTARLQVEDNSVLFSAPEDIPETPGMPPIQGQGRRMMWYPDQAAFRVGYVESDRWDQNNIGSYSFASGYNTIASGRSSTAMGEGTIALGYSSVSMGQYNFALGEGAIAMGTGTWADAFSSTSMGNNTNAIGRSSVSMGEYTYAKASAALSIGVLNNTSDNPDPNGADASDRIFQIGNGDLSTFTPSNALTVLRNGNIGIGTTEPSTPLAFSSSTGQKISLYDSGGNSHYGFSVEPYQLQLYTDAIGTEISFGYYDGGIFNERMVLDNLEGVLTVESVDYPSDARYKKQIIQLQNPIEKIKAINGVEYFMRTDDFPSKNFDTSLQVGLIAQEVEKVLPQVVHTNEYGYKSIDYSKVVPLLVEGIKEQQQQIDQQQIQIDDLKKVVNELIAARQP